MKKYTVYFEIFGKKMRTTVEAVSEKQAKEIIKYKIVFHKVVKEPEFTEDLFDFLKGFKK